jgi:predicted RNA-binding protein
MCLSTAYLDSGGEKREIMKDVARIEADNHGFWLVNLFGERHFIEGNIQTIDLVDSHFVMFEPGKAS